jgi:methylglyoxal/glyoxal reductase
MSNEGGFGVSISELEEKRQERLLSARREIPLLGLGTWQIPDGPECVNAVRWALELGYRHIDTAQVYGNETSVGRGLRESGIARDEVFVTTKFYPKRRDPVAEAEASLRRLGLDYVDLYMVHWPRRNATWSWPGMEQTRELGYARWIGVSNFSSAQMNQLTAEATVMPAVNQVQFSPFEYRRGLLDECERLGVVLEAYSPLGTGRHLADPSVTRIAEALGRTPAQVLLRWCVQRAVPVLAKSTHRRRIEENAQIFDFALSDADMAVLDALDRTGGTDRAHGPSTGKAGARRRTRRSGS